MAILKKLDIFWIKTHYSKKWKLLVFNAVITSKVLYGLETLEPTEAAGRLLNTFQLKGVRKNWNYTPRSCSATIPMNMCVEEPMKLSTHHQKDLGDKSNHKRNSGRQKTETSWACLEKGQHPLHQAAFSTRSALPRETEHRRRGRPQQFWTTNNMSKAWEVIKTHDATQPQIPFDKNNRSKRERIIEQAQRYQPPFNKGNPIWNIQCENWWKLYKIVLSVTPLLSVNLLLSVTPSLSVKLLLSVTPSLSVKRLLSVKFLLHGKISFQ